MPLDKSKYILLIKQVQIAFYSTFGNDILFVKENEAIEHMGHFNIQYKYLPLNYYITFENERDVFCINIYDDEGAKNSLYRIEEFDNQTTLKNIELAIQKLKNILNKNDFCFYVNRDGKLYRKKNKEYKRIKDLNDLIRR